MTAYGPHLMADLEGCPRYFMTDGAFIYRFMQDLVQQIGLTPIGSPHLDLYTGPHDEWEGFSATVHIQTSHITAHFFKFGYVFLDIFSCKPFDIERTQNYIRGYLQPHTAQWQLIARGKTFPAHLIDPAMKTMEDV